MDPEVPGSSPGGGTTRPPSPSVVGAYFCAHARYASYAAARCGFEFHTLDGADGYIFEVVDGSRRALFSAGAGSPYALNDARAASIARDKHFSALTLARAGLPVVPGRLFYTTKHWAGRRTPGREVEDALAFARDAAYPLFCKPVAGSNGVFAERIADAAAFADYMARVAPMHFAILAQPYIRAPEYRVLVLEGRTLAFYRKDRPIVVGDGRRTLRELVHATPRDFGAWPPRMSGRINGASIAADDVPESGACIEVEGPANRAVGGAAAAFAEHAPAPLDRLARAAAATLQLRIAGIDVFDVSPAGDLSDLRIIEVNYNPMIATLEDHGRWDLIEAIWRANFAAALR